jgi:hypothetical protein
MEILSHRKSNKKRDIVITLVNREMNLKEMNLFKDGYWDYFDDLKIERPLSFTIGSIIVSCIAYSFWSYNNNIELGDKIYNLSHYISQENSMQSIIYNFEKGWLAPLNINMSADKDIVFKVPASTSVTVSISVL